MKYWTYILLGVVLSGCQPEPLDIDLPEYEERIAVASQIIPSSVMIVGLSNSFTLLSESGFSGDADTAFIRTLLLDSALVTVEYSSFRDTLFRSAPGIYSSLSVPQLTNVTYELNVLDYRTGRTVQARSTMLPRVTFDTVTVKEIINETDTLVKLDYTFTDVPNQNNYFLVNFYKQDFIQQLLDVNNFFEQGTNRLVEQKLYSDIQAVDGIVKDEIDLRGVFKEDSLVVTLTNISKDYYGYLLQRQRAANDIIGQITNEPINYETNVEGGLGFFNTHNPDIWLITEDSYE